MWQDLRYGLRSIRNQPAFTALAVLTLALGIGAATTIFSVVHGVLLQPLPYRDADRVVTLWQWNQPKGIDEAPSPANFLDWRDASRTLTLLSGFSLVGIVLASIGLYGLVSFSVNARTSEIGIRLALGAGSDSVVGLVMRQGMRIALAGLAAGVGASLLLTRYLRTMLFGVTGSDPATYLLLATAVVLVSAVACYLPARRATRVDPLTAIRV